MKCPHCGAYIEVLSRTNDPETSKQAAAGVNARALCGLVLVAMQDAAVPMIHEDIRQLMGYEHGPDSTIRARVANLKDMGYVKWTGQHKLNSHQRKCRVWQVTDSGIEMAIWLSAVKGK